MTCVWFDRHDYKCNSICELLLFEQFIIDYEGGTDQLKKIYRKIEQISGIKKVISQKRKLLNAI